MSWDCVFSSWERLVESMVVWILYHPRPLFAYLPVPTNRLELKGLLFV